MLIKIYMIPWFVLLYCFVCVVCFDVCDEQQRKKSFQFISLGHSRSKKSCRQLCCDDKRCQVSVYTGRKCFGLHCNNPKYCKRISEQLQGFSGHRVDKRSIDALANETSKVRNISSTSSTRVRRSSTEEEEYDDDIEQDEDDEEEANHRTRYKATENQENDSFKRTLSAASSCPRTKSHHSVIPERHRGFIFHKFHGHTPSLSHCSMKCCKQDDCVLSFKVEHSCYGILCGRNRNCHVRRDKLPKMKIFFSNIQHDDEGDENLNEDRYHLAHHQRHQHRHKNLNRNNIESKEEKEFMASLEKDAADIAVTEPEDGKVEAEQDADGDSTFSKNRKKKQKHDGSRHIVHHHHDDIESHAEEFERDTKKDRIPFVEQSHGSKKDFEDSDDVEERRNTMQAYDSPSRDRGFHNEVRDDMEMLRFMKDKNTEPHIRGDEESIGATLRKHDINSASGESEEGTTRIHAHHHHHTRHHHRNYHRPSVTFDLQRETIHGEDKKGNAGSGDEQEAEKEDNYTNDMRRILSSNTSLTVALVTVNLTNHKATNLNASPSVRANSSEVHLTSDNSVITNAIKPFNVTTRSKIAKPSSEEEIVHRYEHKEDIFKEFHHTEKEHRHHAEEDEDSSGGEESSAEEDFIQPKHKKKKIKPKQKHLKHSTTAVPSTTTSTTPATTTLPTTTASPTTTTTTTTTPTTTTTTTTTPKTTSSKKVVAVLKYQRHRARPTKALQTTNITTASPTTTPTPLTTTSLTTTTYQKSPKKKKKKIKTTTTPKHTTTTTTPYTVVPTVEVDGVTSVTTTSKPTAQAANEESLKDLTKTKLKALPHLTKKIPSLNIAIGDEDVETEDVFPSQSTPKLSSSTTTTTTTKTTSKGANEKKLQKASLSPKHTQKTPLFAIQKASEEKHTAQVNQYLNSTNKKPSSLPITAMLKKPKSKAEGRKLNKEISTKGTNIQSGKSKQDINSKSKQILNKNSPGKNQGEISTTAKTTTLPTTTSTTITTTTTTTTTTRPSKIIRPTTPKSYHYSTSFPLFHYDQSNPMPYPYGVNQQQNQGKPPPVYSHYDDAPASYPHESNQDQFRTGEFQNKIPYDENSRNRNPESYPHEKNQFRGRESQNKFSYDENDIERNPESYLHDRNSEQFRIRGPPDKFAYDESRRHLDYEDRFGHYKKPINEGPYGGSEDYPDPVRQRQVDVMQFGNQEQRKTGNLPLPDQRNDLPNLMDPKFNPYNLGYDPTKTRKPNSQKNNGNLQPTGLPTRTPYYTTKVARQFTRTPYRTTVAPHRTTPRRTTPHHTTRRTTPHHPTPTPRLSRPSPTHVARHFTPTRPRPTAQHVTSSLLHQSKSMNKTTQKIVEKFYGKNKTTENKLGPHQLSKTSSKESPQDTVRRILGGGGDTAGTNNRDSLEKPIDTIHRILGKDHQLDDFFKESGKHDIEQKTQSGSLVSFGHEKSQKTKLENFFKKTEIHPQKKNLSEVTGSKKTTLTSNKKISSGNSQNQTNERTNHSVQVPTIKGCAINKFYSNKTFSDVSTVGYMYKLPQTSFEDCVKSCCSHDSCHVAFYDDNKVCNLVQCKKPWLCEQLSPTTKDIRLVFMKKSSASQPRYCQQQSAVGVPWQRTKAGEVAVRDCPRDAIGEAKRACSIHSKWLPPDFSDCVSNNYATIRDKAKGLGFTSNAQSVIQELDDASTETIDNSLIFGGDLQKATETINKIAKFLIGNQKENFGHDELKGAVRIVSNLLDTANTNEWEHIRDVHGPSKLMKSLEMLGAYAANRTTTSSLMKPVVTSSIMAHVGKVVLDPKKKLNQHFSFPQYSQQQHSEWIMNRDKIVLPKNLFRKDRTTSVSSIVYKTLGSLLPHRWRARKFVTFTDGFTINSNILSCVVSPLPSKVLSPPVLITLHHIKRPRAVKSKCVWWDYNNSNGTWSTDGCSVVKSNRSLTICQCSHLTNFAVLSNTNDQKVSAKEQAKEHTMAIMWLGIPMVVVVAIGALYTCFAWSKVPRRRHVVIMDKKPRLPNDEVVTTQTVSQKYPGSPNKNLYAANYCTSSPSDLEWEHAWDILTNSEFDSSTTKELHRNFKKKLVKSRLLRSKRRNTASESSSTSTADNNIKAESLYFQWKADDGSEEWRKQTFKHLGDGLFDISSENAQPSSISSYDDNQSCKSNTDLPTHHIISTSDSFSPVAMSSPHSMSLEEMLQAHAFAMGKGQNYLQLSFDSSGFGIQGVDPSSMSFDSLNQLMSDIEMTYEDLLNHTRTQTVNSNPKRKGLNNKLGRGIRNTAISSDDTGYQSPARLKKQQKARRHHPHQIQKVKEENEKIQSKLHRDHIFCRWSFETFDCNEFCCMTYIEKLFDDETTKHDANDDIIDSTKSDCPTKHRHNDSSTTSHKKRSAKLNLHLPNKIKRSGSLTPVATASRKLHKYFIQNTTVSASGCRIKKSPKENKQSPTSLYSNTTRLQTRHLKNYIELRQQCRKNDVHRDDDNFPCSTVKQKSTKTVARTPSKKDVRVTKPNLKRQKAFKATENEADTFGKARRKIFQRHSLSRGCSFKSKDISRLKKTSKKSDDRLSISSSMESLLSTASHSLDSNESSLLSSDACSSNKSSPCDVLQSMSATKNPWLK